MPNHGSFFGGVTGRRVGCRCRREDGVDASIISFARKRRACWAACLRGRPAEQQVGSDAKLQIEPVAFGVAVGRGGGRLLGLSQSCRVINLRRSLTIGNAK